MAKEKVLPQKEQYTPRQLDKQQLKWLEEDIAKAGGEEKWLIEQGAIVLNKYGGWSIVVKPDGAMPFCECQQQLTQLNDYYAKKQYAEDQEILRTTGIDPRKERVKKFFADMKEIINHSKVE